MMHANKNLGIRSVVLGSVVALASLVACSGSDKPGASAGSSSGASGTLPPTTSRDGGVNSEGGDGGAEGGKLDGGGGDAGETDGSTLPDGAPLPAACLGVAREGADTAEVSIAAPAPAAGGGTILPGKYLLTKWETYTGVGGFAGPTGEIRRTTLIISGSQAQFATRDVEEAKDVPIVAEQFQLSGATFDSTEICPVPERPRSRGFTVTGAVLSLDESFGALTRRFFYTKQ